MLDKNDRKYVIRRIITYIAIAMIMLLFNSCTAKADTLTYTINYGANPRYFDLNGVQSQTVPFYDNTGNSTTILTNAFGGKIVFSLYYESLNNPSDPIIEVSAVTENGTEFACSYDNPVWYRDNTTQYMIITPSCDVQINNTSLKYIRLRRNGSTGRIYGRLGDILTFLPNQQTTVNNTVNVNQQDVVNAINNSQQATINQIQSSQTQAHQDAQQAHQDAQQINDTLNDSSVDTNGAGSTFSDLDNSMSSNGTISSLITMPITLLQKLLNGLSGNCSAYPIGSIFGYNMSFECINPSNYIGSALWNVIDVICAGFIAYKLGKRFVVIFNQLTNLKDGGLESAYD